jgi:hypothetical protein
VLNTKAKLGKHHHKHHHKYARNYHHRTHKVGAIKTHAKVGLKRTAPVSTRHG